MKEYSLKEKLDIITKNTKQIEKTYGTGAVFNAGEARVVNHPAISTGSIAVDKATGIGGVPRGRITEIYGPESSGKTTLCLSIIAEAHRNPDSVCAFIDMEHALDISWAEHIGVDLSRLWISQPDSGEQALEIAQDHILSGVMDIVVVDSVAALVPRAEIEGQMGDSHIGLQARLMSQALRKLTSVVKSTNTTLMFTNQIREKVGVMWGSPETTSGGRALKFYASMRFDIRRKTSIKKDGDVIGNRTKVKVVKNKLAAPFREAEFDIRFEEGISTLGEIVDYAADMDIIQKRAAYYKYNDETIGQGRENTIAYLIANPEFTFEIHNKILANLDLPLKEVMPNYGRVEITKNDGEENLEFDPDTGEVFE